jgi:hypothetical protein
VFLLAGCGSTGALDPSATPTVTETPTCPGPRRADASLMIDYVDFVQALGRQYVNMQRFKPTVLPRERV